jgi:hypothetical protein
MQARSAEWAANPPSQPNLVAHFLKGILAHYKLRIPENEPVTVGRIRQLCRRVDVRCEDIVGCSIERFIELNR